MFKFQYCSSFAFNFISSFSHLNWLGWWYPTVLLGFWRCKNTDFSTGVWSFGVNVSSLRTPRDNNWEILFLCSLTPSSEIFISTGREEMNLRFLLGESQFQANWFSSQFAIPAKWCSALLSFDLFPGGRLAIYSIALSVPYLNGSFPAERTLDLFVSKRIVFLWAYCSSSLRCGLLQIDSRNKRKALLVWVFIPLYVLLHLLTAVNVSYLQL